MTTTMTRENDLEVAVDTLAALEQRVIRAIDLLNREREQRTAAEKQVEDLRHQLQSQHQQSDALRGQIENLHQERDTVRTRVERLMATLDSIEAS